MSETFPPEVWKVPASLSDLASDVRRTLAGHPAAALVEDCLTNTWTTTMRWSGDEVFVATGDIPAMWLRDSTAQVRPYLAAASDQTVADALAGVSRRQIRCVLADPYANAFNDGPDGRHGDDDRPVPGPWVWEQKYEVDSLCAPLQLAHGLWRATGRTDHLGDDFRVAARIIVDLWRLEQRHEDSPYTFRRLDPQQAHDSLPNDGRGTPVGFTGMTWSAFRPSDDRCEHHYLVPSNALAVVSLLGLAEIARTVLGDETLGADAARLAAEIDTGIEARAIDADGLISYEVDGLGHRLIADDANLPSLLSLPFIGWCAPDDPRYLTTRETVLSATNPWYHQGRYAGIGSPHTPPGYIWPLAIATAGLTAREESDRVAALELLATTTGGTGLMHEGFHVDDPRQFTRAWFGWANAMFAELALLVAGTDLSRHFPRHPRA